MWWNTDKRFWKTKVHGWLEAIIWAYLPTVKCKTQMTEQSSRKFMSVIFHTFNPNKGDEQKNVQCLYH